MSSSLRNVSNKQSTLHNNGVPRVWGVQTPLPLPPSKFWRPSKILPNSTRLWELLKIPEFRKPVPQEVRKGGKIKKILLHEMKFLVLNYSCLQNPWLGATVPRSPFPLSSVLNWICWNTHPPAPEQNSWVCHCCITSQLSENLICNASEAWNHELPLQSSFSRPGLHKAIEWVQGESCLILKIAYFLENCIGSDDWQCCHIRGECFYVCHKH